MSRLALAFARPLKQSRGLHVHCDRQAVDDVDRCAVDRPFQRADIGAVKARAVGELFLREPFCLPCSPQVLRKNLSNIHLLDFVDLSSILPRSILYMSSLPNIGRALSFGRFGLLALLQLSPFILS